MKRLQFVLFVICSLLLCGCMNTNTEHLDLYLTALYSFPGPGVDQAKILNTSIIKDVETDYYGRKMCTVWIPRLNFYFIDGGINKKGYTPSMVKIILQQSNETHIYYYEDACFLFASADGFTTERIEQLEERNDWNQHVEC